MEKNMQTGKRIQARREELGLNLGDIAQKVGVAVSTIQRYEKGKIEKIKLPVIEAIAKALAVDPAWLLGQTDCPTPAAQEPVIDNLLPLPKTYRIPLIGDIACGRPSLLMKTSKPSWRYPSTFGQILRCAATATA